MPGSILFWERAEELKNDLTALQVGKICMKKEKEFTKELQLFPDNDTVGSR